MTELERMRLQYHLNTTLATIVDGRLADLIAELAKDKTPDMQLEITLLRKIYERFMSAKPLIDQLQQRGTQIIHAKTN